MKPVIASIAAIGLVAVAGAVTVVYSGVLSVAATDPHWTITDWVLRTARERSIKAHAAGLAPPSSLGDEERILAGAVHYATHCVACHGAPDTSESDLAHGLSPKPARITEASRRYSAGELFWILKNGIKMTGMPSWASHGDDELWSIVAFLQKLPALSPDEYRRLTAAAAADPNSHDHAGAPGQHHHHPPGAPGDTHPATHAGDPEGHGHKHLPTPGTL
jgi:mono/diheme cytochrome c family protein